MIVTIKAICASNQVCMEATYWSTETLQILQMYLYRLMRGSLFSGGLNYFVIYVNRSAISIILDEDLISHEVFLYQNKCILIYEVPVYSYLIHSKRCQTFFLICYIHDIVVVVSGELYNINFPLENVYIWRKKTYITPFNEKKRSMEFNY